MSIADLYRAVCKGKLDVIRRLVQEEKVDVNKRYTSDGRTLLHDAVLHDQPKSLKFLMENNAHVNVAWGNSGTTPLHLASARENIEILQSLLDHKADTTAICHDGRTAFHVALRFNPDFEAVQCLLDHKAPVNATDHRGRTPLHTGVHFNMTAPVMELLLSYGANLYAKDHDGKTPLPVLVERDLPEVVGVIFDHLRSNYDLGKLESVLLDDCDNSKRIPFHYVKSPEMAKLFLEQPLRGDDQLVPHICHTMLFARGDDGKSLADAYRWSYRNSLHDYLASYTDIPLSVPAMEASAPACEHRVERQHHDVAVRLNPRLNKFQSAVAESFVEHWNKWSTLRSQQEAAVVKHNEREHDGELQVPVELKYAIMAYLSTADIMKIHSTK